MKSLRKNRLQPAGQPAEFSARQKPARRHCRYPERTAGTLARPGRIHQPADGSGSPFHQKASGGMTKLIQLMHPGKSGLKDFSLAAVPEHDRGKTPAPNIFTLPDARIA